MSCVHSHMSCDHSRTGCVHSTHARRRWRLHCAFTAHLLRNVGSAIAQRFFLTCSKFDGAHSACLAHLGDSTAYVWRTQSVNEDPRAYVAHLQRISYFFVRRVSAVASQASGTGALAIDLKRTPHEHKTVQGECIMWDLLVNTVTNTSS